MKKTILFGFCLISAGLANHAKATVYYWDPEGAATGTAANLAATWTTTSAQWSTSSTQTASPTTWVSSYAANFCTSTTSVGTPFTVTVNSAINTIGGIFNGSLGIPGVFVTLSGTGSLGLAAGADAFATGGNGSGSTTIAVPMTGSGQVALEGPGQVYFNGTNTYTGGTSIGYAGVTAFTGTVNVNNSKSFGTGAIMMTANGNGSTLAVEGSSAVTLPNTVNVAGINFNVTGNAGGLTFSGPWTLTATPIIGSANLVIISGVMSGAGGFSKYGAGTLVFGGSNSYTGGTTISNGVVSVTADYNLGTASGTPNYNIYLSGGTLNASNSFTLNQNRLISLTANSSISVSSGNTLSYAGTITGSSSLSKTGAGTLALSGDNGYTGTTTITSGTLEADSQGGSSVGTHPVTVQSVATLSGSGVVSGTVSGAGTVAPGTSAGPANLTLGNGLNLSSGGTYAWDLSTNSTTNNFSTISLIGGTLTLGGTSKLSANFTGAASAPATNNPFWQTQEAWTIISLSGSAVNPSVTHFANLLNGSYAAGNFTNYVDGNNNIVLLYQPNFAAFDVLNDSGSSFFGGEYLTVTNFSGLNLFVWSSTDASLSVSNWTMVGQLEEHPLNSAMPGYSYYIITVDPTVSPTYYIAGNTNAGPYIVSPVPATILTTPDFVDFTVMNTNVAIDPTGVLGLLPAPPTPPVILPGSAYSGGQFQFQFSADTNQTYTVQGSTDLIIWTNVGSGTVSNSPTTFIDPAATNYSTQFYRVVVP